jgi:hypothetical protein
VRNASYLVRVVLGWVVRLVTMVGGVSALSENMLRRRAAGKACVTVGDGESP